MLEGDSFSMNEPNGGRNREDSDNQGEQLSDEQAHSNIAALKDKIQRAKAQLDQANEDHKQNVLHTETINMMSKYQLVFIKLEKSLCQLCCMVKERNKRHLLSGFKALVGYSQYKGVQTKYKGNLVGTLMKQAITTLFRGVTRVRKNLKRVGWNALATRWQLMKRTSEAQSAISKQLEDIGEKSRKREHELAMTSKRVEELQNIIGEYNVREKELNSKIKAKDRQISALETEVKTATIKRSGSSNYGGNNGDDMIGNLEAKLRDLEAENKELHEQMTFADSNMGNFIKEMSDLLDSHELISTDDHNNVLGGNYNNDGDEHGGQEMLGKEHGGGMKGGAGNRNMIGNVPKRGMTNAQPANSTKNAVVKRSSYLS